MARVKLFEILAVTACVATATPGATQCRLCTTPVTTRESADVQDELRLEVESALAFGRVIISGEGAGSVAIHPDGSTSSNGAVAGVTTRAMVGSITVRGQPGRAIRVDLPRRIELFSLNGAQVQVHDLTSDLPGLPKLDATGTLTFRFGGRIEVDGEADGDFRGELPIIVEYL